MDRFPTAENIVAVLDDLGLNQVHVAGRLDTDWTRFVVEHADRVASLALIFPGSFDTASVAPLAERMVLIEDERPATKAGRDAVAARPGATVVTMSDYAAQSWTDVVADHPEAVLRAMTDLIARGEKNAAPLRAGNHEANGVAYHVEGSGPPLLLLPLTIAPSQWEPLLPNLRQRFTLITLGAQHIGFVPILEERGRTGYSRTTSNVVDEMGIQPNSRLIEVGCGTGVLSRALAHRFGTTGSTVTAVDINAFLLREAQTLSVAEGVDGVIDFQSGSIENLPFEDESFDAVMSFTVLEEVDADLALTELTRITKPGGRIGIVVRAIDRHWQINLDISDEMRAKVEAPGGLAGANACADSSLYKRLADAGLTDLRLLPHVASLTGPMAFYYLDRFQGRLAPGELPAWRAAIEQGLADGTLFVGQPFHCAVGTKHS